MKAIAKPTSTKPVLLFSLTAIVVILFMFFIDEGRHSFEGMMKPVHLLTFLIYVIPTVLAQLLIYKLLTRLHLSTGKLFFSSICGLFIGITTVIFLFYLIQ